MMKKLTLPVVLLLLAACAPLAPDVRRTEGAPTFPASAFPPEVLEQVPARPHVQVGVVDAKGVLGQTPSQVIARIREQAQLLGADAVILQDVSVRQPAESTFNPAIGGFAVTQGSAIPAFKGIAIRYQR
jgi:hypothetical protein